MHCASLLRTIFTSLARANERLHVHNDRNFPQAKLDSEISVLFLLNEHGDLYFLLLNNSVHINFFKSKKFKRFLSEGKKIQVEACKKYVLWNANYDRENNDYANALRPRGFKWSGFSTHFILYCSKCLTLSTCQVYSQVFKLCFQLKQNITWTDE